MKRRFFIKSSVLAVPALLLGGAAKIFDIKPTDPLPELLRRWKKAAVDIEAAPAEESEQRCEHHFQITNEIYSSRPTTKAGARAAIEFLAMDLEDELRSAFDNEWAIELLLSVVPLLEERQA